MNCMQPDLFLTFWQNKLVCMSPGPNNLSFQHSCAGELQEALETINELTKDLEEATRSNQEILQENEALQEELQTLRDTNNELTQQTDQLDKMIKEERMKSVSIVQEQLQKQHELTRQTDAANQELIERDECLTRLQAELEKTQTNEEALKNQLHKLEQALFEQQAAGKEKELLQKLDLQGQLGHFQHGEETVEKRLQDKSSRHEKVIQRALIARSIQHLLVHMEIFGQQ